MPFSDAAIQARLALKVLFRMPLRPTIGFVQSLLRLVGLDCAVQATASYTEARRPLVSAFRIVEERVD